MDRATQKLKEVFIENGGLVRTRQVLATGVHPRTLYRLRDEGVVERMSRGVYRWAELEPLGQPDLVAVATRAPKGVICLLSALFFHEITTQIPHEIYVAVRRDSTVPRIDHPPVRVFKYSVKSFSAGRVKHNIDGVSVRIFSAARTVADCFQRRGTVGLDVAIEALRMTLETRRASPAEILEFARICRVSKVITPYIEALV